MKIRHHLLRYLLVAGAWILMLIALPLRACDFNGFLGWQGEKQTMYFIRWIFGMPWQFSTDIKQGLAVPWTDIVWTLFTFIGLILLLAAPAIIYRARGKSARMVFRVLAAALLFLPVIIFLPRSFHFPVADSGLELVAAAQMLGFVALILGDARPDSRAVSIGSL